MDNRTIEREALHLPISGRTALVHKLPASLDELSEAENEVRWLEEAERRAAEIDAGTVQLASSEVVSRQAREMLR